MQGICPDCGYDFCQDAPLDDEVCPICGWPDTENLGPQQPNEEDIEGIDDGVWQ